MAQTIRSEQLALDYIIYMMAGSFFQKARFDSRWRERFLLRRYLFTRRELQYQLEEDVERYFIQKIEPELPVGFLDRIVSVRWERTKSGKYTAVVFSCGSRELWIAGCRTGRNSRPVFEHWTVGIQAGRSAG